MGLQINTIRRTVRSNIFTVSASTVDVPASPQRGVATQGKASMILADRGGLSCWRLNRWRI